MAARCRQSTSWIDGGRSGSFRLGGTLAEKELVIENLLSEQ
jgi:hypothetical protein